MSTKLKTATPAARNQPKPSPVTSVQLGEMTNRMSRRERASVAKDLEHSAKALQPFAKMIRR
jgi:hypothetical protein